LNILFIAGTGNKYYNLAGWQEYIKGKHDIDILVRYPDNSSEIIDKSATLDSILYIHNTGVYDAGNQMVFKSGRPETAYELSAYYEKYQWHRYFDSDFIERLRSGGGDICGAVFCTGIHISEILQQGVPCQAGGDGRA
jgi:hypothetical protein